MEQQNAAQELQQEVNALKVRLFDAGEQLKAQGDMLNAISEKLKFKGNSFEELLALIPAGNEATQTEGEL